MKKSANSVLIVLCFCLLTTLPTMGQKRTFSFGLSLGAQHNNYTFLEENFDFHNRNPAPQSAFPWSFKGRVGKSAGFDLKYEVLDFISIRSGIWYSDQGYLVDHPNPSIQPAWNNSDLDYQIFNLYSLQCPMLLAIDFYRRERFWLGANTGFNLGFLLVDEEVHVTQTGNVDRQSNPLGKSSNEGYFSGSVALELGYVLNDRFSLVVNPYIGKELISDPPIYFEGNHGFYGIRLGSLWTL